MGRKALHAIITILVGATVCTWCVPCGAQELASTPGSGSWFDWSDFRAYAGARASLVSLVHASIKRDDREFDLKNKTYGFTKNPEPIREVWGVLYIDRLGLRVHVDSTRFLGSATGQNQNNFVSELRVPTTRLGLDLDVIRYPYVRIGGNFDYQIGQVQFIDRTEPYLANPSQANLEVAYRFDQPITVGVHGRAIPFRLREIPFTIQARGRVSLPFLNRPKEARLTDIEISGGLRPNIWDTSLLGLSTFSISLEVGYRWIDLDAKALLDQSINSPFIIIPSLPPDATLKARWQGAFIQAALFF